MNLKKIFFMVAIISMIMPGTVYASTLEQDGYMLTNTTTPDGYLVGADGTRIDNNASNQFQIKSEVRYCMNAHSLDELVAGLSNVEVVCVRRDVDSSAEYVEEYDDIKADGLPTSVMWITRQASKENPLGAGYVNVADETAPKFYGLKIWACHMTEVFDGLTKSSYTVEEFEDMLRTIGATNIESKSEKSSRSVVGIITDEYDVETEFELGKIDGYDVETKFDLGNYECSVISHPGSSVVYVPYDTDVYINTKFND